MSPIKHTARYRLMLALLTACSYLTAPAFALEDQIDTYLIENVTVIPMTKPGLRFSHQSVLIRNGKISSVAATAGFIAPKNAYKIDGRGKFLLPGLTEMHAHIPVAQRDGENAVHDVLFLYLSQGITTIRGMLGDPYHLELRESVRNGTVLGPRIYTSSPSLNGRTVGSAEVAERKVRQYKADGYDFLKIHPGVSLEAMQALVRTAKEVGMEVSGHVPAEVGIRRALGYQYGTIDHIDGYITGLVPGGANADDGGFFGFAFAGVADSGKIEELIQLTNAHQVAIVPTQTLFTRWAAPGKPELMAAEPEMQYMPRRTIQQWIERKRQIQSEPTYSAAKHRQFIELRNTILRTMHDNGVTILLGSDAPQVFNVPGYSIFHELEAMVDAGIPIEAALISGTIEAAKYFSASSEFGSIRVGSSADLILLDADPLQDIRNMRKQAGVMRRGQWLDRTSIDARLAAIAAKHRDD